MQTVATKTVGSRSWISGDGLLSRQVEKRRLRVSVNRQVERFLLFNLRGGGMGGC